MVPVPHLRRVPRGKREMSADNARRRPGGMAMMETTDMMCLETWGYSGDRFLVRATDRPDFHSRTCHISRNQFYPLVNCYITMENHHFFNGKIHYFYGHFQ